MTEKFTDKDLHSLLGCYSFEPIVSRNPYMRSWANEDARINHYFKSNKFQIQKFSERGPGKIIQNPDLEQLEYFL